MNKSREYTDNVYRAITANYNNLMGEGSIYYGEDGARRLAREYGFGLNDFPYKDAVHEIGNSYGSLCVRLFNLMPPIDAIEWNNEVMGRIKKV